MAGNRRFIVSPTSPLANVPCVKLILPFAHTGFDVYAEQYDSVAKRTGYYGFGRSGALVDVWEETRTWARGPQPASLLSYALVASSMMQAPPFDRDHILTLLGLTPQSMPSVPQPGELLRPVVSYHTLVEYAKHKMSCSTAGPCSCGFSQLCGLLGIKEK